MILSHRHKFIFFCNGRTGTTSIEHALRPLQEGAQYDFGIADLFVAKHVPPALLKPCLPDQLWRDYFKFVFVRNPWDWIVSNWFYNFGQGRPPGRFARWRHALRRPQTSATPCLETKDIDNIYAILQRHRGLPSRDVCYQSTWVFDMEGRQLVDEIGRFETLGADFARIQQQLGLDIQLPHLNRTERRDYRAYFSPAAAQRVAELWAVDVKSFGYTFGEVTGRARR